MNIRARALLGWVAVIALSAALAACGGSGEQPDLTTGEITDAQLNLMVLGRADLGEEYADLQFIEQAGFLTNETRVKWALDPEDEASDLERFGRVNGYEAAYVAFARPAEGAGLDEIRVGVSLFADAAGASAYLEDELADIEQGTGGQHAGMILEDVKRFKVGGIADRSVGFRARATAAAGQDSAAPTNVTQVYFRRGRLLADVAIGRVDEEDASEAVQTLARKLDERIQAVLRGEVTPTPTVQP